MLNKINELLKKEQETKEMDEQVKRRKQLEAVERQEATNEVLEMAKLLGINLEMNNTIVKNEVTININKGKIVKAQTIKEVVVDNTDNNKIQELEDKIENLEIELESKDDFMKGMKFSYERQIAELKEKYEQQISELETEIKRLNTKTMFLEAEDEVFEEEEIVTDNEGGVAVPLFNIPEEYKDNQEIKSLVEKKTEEYNNAQGFGAGPFQITAEQEREEIIKQTNKAILNCIEEYELINKYELDIKEIRNKKNNTIVAIEGFITLAGNKHLFKYGATHKKPFIYGCWDEKLALEAKEILDKATNMIKDETEEKHINDVHYDFEKGIAVFQENDGTFKACVRYDHRQSGGAMCFTWDSKHHALPCGDTLNNVINRYKRDGEIRLTTAMKEGRNNGQFELAKYFMTYCETIDKCNVFTKEEKQTTNDKEPKETNEIVVNTNDVVLNVAPEIDEIDA